MNDVHLIEGHSTVKKEYPDFDIISMQLYMRSLIILDTICDLNTSCSQFGEWIGTDFYIRIILYDDDRRPAREL